MFYPCRHFGDPLSKRFTKFHRCNLAKTLPLVLLPPSCREKVKTILVRPERPLTNGECFLETHFCSRPRLATIRPFMWSLTDLKYFTLADTLETPFRDVSQNSADAISQKSLSAALLPPSCRENKTIPVRPVRLSTNGECFSETHFCSRSRLTATRHFMWSLTDLRKNSGYKNPKYALSVKRAISEKEKAERFIAGDKATHLHFTSLPSISSQFLFPAIPTRISCSTLSSSIAPVHYVRDPQVTT
ncbi:hypothetical protein CEXT_510711 [Caerostris extrusa]|uniref:Uncharacterized protein n=1 Tax=Caerostris extrusa TaxID=172846 RepID=A0AAV4WPN3_CAEEX|nr:hypothetical protein CEXT_510711 [Caerostris extrusa]